MYSYLVVYAKVMKPELLQYSSHHQSSKGWIDTCLRFLYPLHKVLPFLQLCGRSNQDLEICLLSFMPHHSLQALEGLECRAAMSFRESLARATKRHKIGSNWATNHPPMLFRFLYSHQLSSIPVVSQFD